VRTTLKELGQFAQQRVESNRYTALQSFAQPITPDCRWPFKVGV